MVPFFGCLPHTPERVFPERARFATRSQRRAVATCSTCGGGQPEGSSFVCMACHAVAPEHQAHFDRSKVEAIATREPEQNLMRRSAYDKLGPRSVFTVEERAELVAEYPQLAPTWLDSIGQPAVKPGAAAEAVAA
jgi:hypothetical protein